MTAQFFGFEFFSLKKKHFIFLELSYVYNEIKRKVQKFPICPLPPYRHSLPILSITHQNGTVL